MPSSISNLTSKVNKLNIVKLETTPVDLSQLSHIVKTNVVKKTEYDAKSKTLKIIYLVLLN